MHRRAQARVGEADHRGRPLFRLCPPGPEARAAHADLGQAGRQPDHRRGRRPGAVGRPPRRADPGLLRYPDGQSLRRAGDVGGHPTRASAASNLMVVSPDVGGVVRARALAKRLDNAPLAIVDKRRERAGEFGGDEHHRRGRGPLLHPGRRHRRFGRARSCNAAAALCEAGAEGVVAYVTHGVLSGGAVARVEGSVLTELVITDSIGNHEVDRRRRARSATCRSRRCSARRSSGSRTRRAFEPVRLEFDPLRGSGTALIAALLDQTLTFRPDLWLLFRVEAAKVRTADLQASRFRGC